MVHRSQPGMFWSWPRVGCLVAWVVLQGFALALPSDAQVRMPRGLAVVVDPATLSRTATIDPGGYLTLELVVTDEDATLPDGWSGGQFGFDIDPRLQVVAVTPGEGSFFNQGVGPFEWLISFTNCISPQQLPFVLMTYLVQLPASEVGAQDLRVEPRDLVSYGEPMLLAHCVDRTYLQPVANLGGVILNPTGVQIAHFSASEMVLVEGRPLQLGWETLGASTVTLDGVSQPVSGQIQFTPTMTATYRLTATDGLATVTDSLEIELIRRPRVESFVATVSEGTGGDVSLSWFVSGSDEVLVEGAPQWPIGGTLVPANTGPIWTLTATNSWGTTTAIASLDSATSVPPVIVRFEMGTANSYPGRPTELVYELWNADSASIEPDIGAVDPVSGRVSVSTSVATTYVLSASNAYGVTTQSLEVVPNPPTIAFFGADVTSGPTGTRSKILWHIDGADSARIDPGLGFVDPDSGEVSVSILSDRTYTLTAWNAVGSSSHSLTLRDLGTPIYQFEPSRTTIAAGIPIELRWQVAPGYQLRIDPQVGPLTAESGLISVTPPADRTVYTLSAAALDTTITASTPPIVWTAPRVIITRSLERPLYMEPFELQVQIFGADSATLEPGFGAIDPAGGVFSTSIADTTVFTVSATNSVGTTIKTMEVIPNLNLPSVSLSVDNPNPLAGEQFLLTVQAADAESLTVEPGFGAIDPGGAQLSTSIQESTTFVAIATNRWGSAVDSLLVAVNMQLPQLSMTAIPPNPFPGQPFSLVISSVYSDSLVLEPGFGSIAPTGGSFTTAIDSSTTFIATGFNRYGQSSVSLLVEPDFRLPVATLSLTPPQPFAGEAALLSTFVALADSAWIEPNIVSEPIVNGSQDHSVTFADTTNVILHAMNRNGSVQDTLLVQPLLPVVSLTGDSVVRAGTSVTLQVIAEGAQTVTLEPHFGTIVGSGNYSVVISEPTEFVLAATNPLGTVTAVHQVSTSALIERFAATPGVAIVGAPVLLFWQVSSADSVQVSDGVGFDYRSTTLSDSVIVREDSDRTYVLRAFSQGAEAAIASLTVTRIPLGIRYFSASPVSVAQGDSVSLSWQVIGSTQASISSIGTIPPSGTVRVKPRLSTRYVLTASNGSEVVTAEAVVHVGLPSAPTLLLSFAPDIVSRLDPEVILYEDFHVYVHAAGMTLPLQAFEFSVRLPPGVILADAVIPYPNPLNIGAGTTFIAGIGTCVYPQPLIPLVDLTLIIVDQNARGSIDVRGSIPSSFPDQSPGFQVCSGELLTFAEGPPLLVNEIVVPVLIVEATATRDEAGVRVRWKGPADMYPETVRILRRHSSREFEAVATMDGAREGTWLDTEVLESQSVELSYRVVLERGELVASSADITVQEDGPPNAVVARDRLLPNIPNPFNPSTDLRFELAESGLARLEIYDTAGRRVWSWRRDGLSVGQHRVTWNGLDDHGRRVSSGVYLVRLNTRDAEDHQRIVMLK